MTHEEALRAIVHKGNRCHQPDLCRDCYETECDTDCPVLIATHALGAPCACCYEHRQTYDFSDSKRGRCVLDCEPGDPGCVDTRPPLG